MTGGDMARRRVHNGYDEPSEAFLQRNLAWRRRSRGGPTSLHHLLPRFRGGGNACENLVQIPHVWHEGWHRAFGLATPQEAIDWLSEWPHPSLPVEWQRCNPSQECLRALFPAERYSFGVFGRVHCGCTPGRFILDPW